MGYSFRKYRHFVAPSCMLELARFSTLLRIQDGAECGNIIRPLLWVNELPPWVHPNVKSLSPFKSPPPPNKSWMGNSPNYGNALSKMFYHPSWEACTLSRVDQLKSNNHAGCSGPVSWLLICTPALPCTAVSTMWMNGDQALCPGWEGAMTWDHAGLSFTSLSQDKELIIRGRAGLWSDVVWSDLV